MHLVVEEMALVGQVVVEVALEVVAHSEILL
jgi:hypothetical protein